MPRPRYVAELIAQKDGQLVVEGFDLFDAEDDAAARRAARDWAAAEKAILYTATTLRLREDARVVWEGSLSEAFDA